MATKKRKKATRKKAARKKTTGKKTTRRKATRKKAAGKATRKKAARKKAPARKKTARKKAPARKQAGTKKSTKKATRKAPAGRKAGAAKKAAPARKPAPRKAAVDPMRALARKIVKAGQDPGALDIEELYTADCESLEAGSTEPAVGHDGIREKMAGWEQMQEGASFTPLNVWTGPNTVCVEWEGEVKMRGGPTVSLKEVAVHEIRGGKIARERYFYNPLALAPQAGASPPAAEPASDEPPPWASSNESPGFD